MSRVTEKHIGAWFAAIAVNGRCECILPDFEKVQTAAMHMMFDKKCDNCVGVVMPMLRLGPGHFRRYGTNEYQPFLLYAEPSNV